MVTSQTPRSNGPDKYKALRVLYYRAIGSAEALMAKAGLDIGKRWMRVSAERVLANSPSSDRIASQTLKLRPFAGASGGFGMRKFRR